MANACISRRAVLRATIPTIAGAAAVPVVGAASAAADITMTPQQLEDAMRMAFLVGRLPTWEQAELLQILETEKANRQGVWA